MFKVSLVSVLLSSFLIQSNVVIAGGCQKTLMGSDCAQVESATSSHMRENAKQSAKAEKELKAAIAKAKMEAQKLALKK